MSKFRICQGCFVCFKKRKTGGNKGLYCSRECSYRSKSMAAALVRQLKEFAKQVCTGCSSGLRDGKSVFCEQCRRKKYEEGLRRWSESAAQKYVPVKAWIKRKCVICKTRFETNRHTQMTCGGKCAKINEQRKSNHSPSARRCRKRWDKSLNGRAYEKARQQRKNERIKKEVFLFLTTGKEPSKWSSRHLKRLMWIVQEVARKGQEALQSANGE